MASMWGRVSKKVRMSVPAVLNTDVAELNILSVGRATYLTNFIYETSRRVDEFCMKTKNEAAK